MPTGMLAVAVLTGVLLALPEAAVGQVATAPACPAESVASSPRAAADSVAAVTVPADSVDIAIIASATVREIRFARPPEIRIRLCGGLDSVRVLERRNLPARVVAGQTYRDVYVAIEILGRVDAACLARKLGVAPPPAAASAVPDAAACAGITVGSAATGTSGTAPVAPRSGTEGAPAAARPPEPRR